MMLRFTKQWSEALISGFYQSHPIPGMVWIRAKGLCYGPYGVLFELFRYKNPSRYKIDYSSAGRTGKIGYKHVLMTDTKPFVGACGLTTLPLSMLMKIGAPMGVAIDLNLLPLKGIDKLRLELESLRNQAELRSDVERLLDVVNGHSDNDMFLLNELAYAGLSHRMMGLLIRYGGCDAHKYYDKYQIAPNIERELVA